MKKGLVSIIMPTHNSAKTIENAVGSVLAQTYSDFELLITDDASTDSTVELVNHYTAQDGRIIVQRLSENQGAGAARNFSIKRASGEYIAFLDADDLWLPEKLEMQIEFMRDNNVLFSYTAYKKFSDKGVGGEVYPAPKTHYKRMLYANSVLTSTAVFNCDKLGKHYMPLIRKRQDLALWLDLLKSVKFAYSVGRVLTMYKTDGGMSSNKFEIIGHQWRFYKEFLGLGYLKAGQYFLGYALTSAIKYIK